MDGLCNRLSVGVKKIVCRFGIEAFYGFFLEIKSCGVFAQKLIVIIVDHGESPPVGSPAANHEGELSLSSESSESFPSFWFGLNIGGQPETLLKKGRVGIRCRQRTAFARLVFASAAFFVDRRVASCLEELRWVSWRSIQLDGRAG
jgi:hypothetical protein